MHKFINLNSLKQVPKGQYRDAIKNAFPPIIGESQVIKNNWSKLEIYYPEFQLLLLSKTDELIGMMNTVPFQFNESLSLLPDRGWDWMLRKGIADYENKNEANYLGGLQIIVRNKFQSQGFSKVILSYAKRLILDSKFENLVIPIRPTKKHEFPSMPMLEYMNLKTESTIYDPWIRTHLTGGAEVIKVCEQSMKMEGNIEFWEKMLGKKIHESGSYHLSGALNLIKIDVENNKGEYVEPNIWIRY